jgi:hypothetical protein
MLIDIRKLMQERNLDRSTLARVLFPLNKHPNMALTRHMCGSSQLTESQIYRLSIYTCLPIEALYEEFIAWKKKEENGLVRFSRDTYSAIYSPVTGITKIYQFDSLLATHIISKSNQPLNEYLEEVNQVIINNSIKS